MHRSNFSDSIGVLNDSNEKLENRRKRFNEFDLKFSDHLTNQQFTSSSSFDLNDMDDKKDENNSINSTILIGTSDTVLKDYCRLSSTPGMLISFAEVFCS
jgi:hypothetical protein